MKYMRTGPDFFLDSNIWLYALSDEDDEKAATARRLINELGGSILFTTQSINEVCKNLKKKSSVSEREIQRLISSFFINYKLVEIDEETLIFASEIRERHSFSFWDSLIVSSAFVGNADILYSEDMQDGFTLENRLKIINPFNK